MSDCCNPKSESVNISVDDWKKVQFQLAENKARLDYYYGDAERRYHELHQVRKRVTAIEAWQKSLMFWLKFAAWSLVAVVAIFLLTTAVFVFSNEDIKAQYLDKISCAAAGR